MKSINTTITRLTELLGTVDASTENAVRVLVKNLWNCTLEDEMTPFFCTMIYQIMRPQDISIPFVILKDVLAILEDERNKDIAAMKEQRAAKIAAIRARNAALA